MGSPSEKRINSDQLTLFDLQLTPEELSARQQEILAAEDVLNDAAKKKLLDELLQRRKARQQKRLEQRGREEFPELSNDATSRSIWTTKTKRAWSCST